MERGNTKQDILEASLELFSVQGFDATSISQIAGAVGVRKASLYSHFESKQSGSENRKPVLGLRMRFDERRIPDHVNKENIMEQELKNRSVGKKALIAFFVIVILLSAVVETMICLGGAQWLYIVLMWIPAFSATVANCISIREWGERFSLKRLFALGGFRKRGFRYVLLGCLLPLVYLLVPYMVYWRLYPVNYAYHGVSLVLVLKDILPVMVLGTFISLMSALGEEIGWRGFMVPALYVRLGLNKTLLISSLFWCCWHLPLLIGGDYMSGTPLWYQLPAFVLCILPVGVMAGVLTLESGSMWPAAFLHAAHNNYDQAVFGLITRGDNRMYFVSETGALTILCAWVLAAILYLHARKQGKLL